MIEWPAAIISTSIGILLAGLQRLPCFCKDGPFSPTTFQNDIQSCHLSELNLTNNKAHRMQPAMTLKGEWATQHLWKNAIDVYRGLLD